MGALLEAFAQGWSDPRKLAQSGARVRILQNECLESISHALGVLPQEVELIGEPNLAPYVAIAGLLTPSSPLYFSSVDRKEVHSLARAHANVREMAVDLSGEIQIPVIPPGSVISLQVANGETGVIPDLEALITAGEGSQFVYDFTVAGTEVKLPLPKPLQPLR